jgi:hypothetical protein
MIIKTILCGLVLSFGSRWIFSICAILTKKTRPVGDVKMYPLR